MCKANDLLLNARKGDRLQLDPRVGLMLSRHLIEHIQDPLSPAVLLPPLRIHRAQACSDSQVSIVDD